MQGTAYRPAAELAAADVLLELLAGKSSPLYARLLENRVFERAVFIRREGGRRVYQIEGRDALC